MHEPELRTLSYCRTLRHERALCVIALTCNLNLFAASITANLTAIFLAVLNLAEARDVRAFVVFLVRRHGNSSDHGFF